MKSDPERFFATVQVGVTVVGTLAAVIGGVLATKYIEPVFLSIPISSIQKVAEPLAVGTVVIVLSFALLVFGELVPKSLALRYAERIACTSSRPLNFLARVTNVFVKALTTSTMFVLNLLGVKEKPDEFFVPKEEIKYFIKEGRASGILEETEAALLNGVFEFADTTVEEVMVPKPKFSAIELSTPADQALKAMADAGFSRFPVYKDNTNQIVGILFNKDVFKTLERGREVEITELMRSPFFVPNSIQISKLLREMQRKRTHIAIVIDEQGDVDGLVTIEDIIEEIVGEIEDEFDVEKGGLVEKLKDGTMLIDASASLWDLTDVGLPFEEDEKKEHNTLAGFMLAKLQRIPRGGEFVLSMGRRFTVVDMEHNRIAKVKVEVIDDDDGQDPELSKKAMG